MAERSAKGTGSVRQRPDGTWEARCSINGKRRSFYGEKQADALKAMRDAQKAVDDKTYCDPTKMTFGEWLDIWMEEYAKPTIKITTYDRYKRSIVNHIKPSLGQIKLQSLNTIQIQKFYNDSLKRMKITTVKCTVHAVISSALNKAVKCNIIATNPALGCDFPKSQKNNFHVFTKDELCAFLQKLEEEPLKHLFKLALFTGMRQGEILGLSWKDVNFEKGTITIKQQLQKLNLPESKLFFQTPKNGKERTIYPAPIVMQALKEARREQLMNQMFAGSAWENKANLVFTDKLGFPLGVHTVRNHFKKILRSIGIANMRFHDLRHAYAVMALQAGDDPKTVQNTLGHHTAAFTLDVYAHVTEDMNKNSANRMQEYYKQLNA